MSTVLHKFYQVLPDASVTFRLTIGHGQVGTTHVNLGADEVVHGHENTLELTLGPGEALAGRKLFCTTVVADVRTETNETSVTYELLGGVHPFKETLQERVAEEGDVAFYAATVRFFR